jgi:hypothetical protein
MQVQTDRLLTCLQQIIFPSSPHPSCRPRSHFFNGLHEYSQAVRGRGGWAGRVSRL